MISEKTYVRATELLLHRDCPIEEAKRKEVLACKGKFDENVRVYDCSVPEKILYVLCDAIEKYLVDNISLEDWSVQQIICSEDEECFVACSFANMNTKNVYLFKEIIRENKMSDATSRYEDYSDYSLRASTRNVIPYMLKEFIYDNQYYDPVGNLERWQEQSLRILWGVDKYEKFTDMNEILTSDESKTMVAESRAIYAVGERLLAENISLWDCFVTPESVCAPHSNTASMCISLLIIDGTSEEFDTVDFDVWVNDRFLYVIPMAEEIPMNTVKTALAELITDY